MSERAGGSDEFSRDLVDALKGIVFDCNWQKIGNVSLFKPMKCHRLVKEKNKFSFISQI